MGTKMADYGVAGLENPDFPHCEKGLYEYIVIHFRFKFLGKVEKGTRSFIKNSQRHQSRKMSKYINAYLITAKKLILMFTFVIFHIFIHIL